MAVVGQIMSLWQMKPLASVHNRRKASLTGLNEQAIFHRAHNHPMRQVGFATPVYNI